MLVSFLLFDRKLFLYISSGELLLLVRCFASGPAGVCLALSGCWRAALRFVEKEVGKRYWLSPTTTTVGWTEREVLIELWRMR